MNKIELEKMFDEAVKSQDDNISFFPYWWDQRDFSNENCKKFIFETIIPEVLNSVLSNEFCPYNCEHSIKQKTKELYWITL